MMIFNVKHTHTWMRQVKMEPLTHFQDFALQSLRILAKIKDMCKKQKCCQNLQLHLYLMHSLYMKQTLITSSLHTILIDHKFKIGISFGRSTKEYGWLHYSKKSR